MFSWAISVYICTYLDLRIDPQLIYASSWHQLLSILFSIFTYTLHIASYSLPSWNRVEWPVSLEPQSAQYLTNFLFWVIISPVDTTFEHSKDHLTWFQYLFPSRTHNYILFDHCTQALETIWARQNSDLFKKSSSRMILWCNFQRTTTQCVPISSPTHK